MLDSSVDSRGGGAQGAIGTVGNQRPIGDRPVSSSSVEMSLGSGVAAAQALSAEPSSVAGAAETRDVETEVEVPLARLPSPPPVMSPSSSHDVSAEEATASTEDGSEQGRSVLGGSQFNGRPLYAPPQQPVGTQKGNGYKWRHCRF